MSKKPECLTFKEAMNILNNYIQKVLLIPPVLSPVDYSLQIYFIKRIEINLDHCCE